MHHREKRAKLKSTLDSGVPRSKSPDLLWGGAVVARLAHNQKVAGSNPAPATSTDGSTVEQVAVNHWVVGSIPTRCAIMGEDKVLLHQDITGDCKDSILKEMKALDKIKSEMEQLSMKRFELEKEYNSRLKIIRSMAGIVYDVVENKEPVEYTVNRTNILLKNVNGGNKPW